MQPSQLILNIQHSAYWHKALSTVWEETVRSMNRIDSLAIGNVPEPTPAKKMSPVARAIRSKAALGYGITGAGMGTAVGFAMGSATGAAAGVLIGAMLTGDLVEQSVNGIKGKDRAISCIIDGHLGSLNTTRFRLNSTEHPLSVEHLTLIRDRTFPGMLESRYYLGQQVYAAIMAKEPGFSTPYGQESLETSRLVADPEELFDRVPIPRHDLYTGQAFEAQGPTNFGMSF